MENVKPIPFYRRFAFKVTLYNAALLFSIIAPTRILRNMDYKHLTDRNATEWYLFDYCLDRLAKTDAAAWPETIESFPRILNQQRICVFATNKELMYDSGIMKEIDREYAFDLLFPSPYIDWKTQDDRFQSEVYIRYLLGIDTSKIDTRKIFQTTRTVEYPAGLDRVVIFGAMVRSADGKDFALTLSQSVVDILIHGRAVKERFVILYASVILMGALLTILLSWSVTLPLKRLYEYSRRILTSKKIQSVLPELPNRGEIGEICRALQRLIHDQQRQAESFMRFSSDVVHELRTPLAAIRSALELYAESTDEGEKERIFLRINKRIRQMDNLMDEIRFIGSIESSVGDERCDDILLVVQEILGEFKEAEIRFDYENGVEQAAIAVSCDKAYRVLANLLNNATSFSPEKGSVSISIFREGTFLVIAVRDRGPGIPEEVFSQITRRFFTYRPGNEEKHSGLGLAITDAILRSGGGHLEYRNFHGGGAEFICRIPICG